MRLRGALVIALGAITTVLAFIAVRCHYFELNLCSMSYSRPIYYQFDVQSPNSKVDSKYSLYLYREGGLSPRFESMDEIDNLGGTPVLFIPGNAGSYSQGRSLAALAAEKPEFDWFLIHFDEDLSALHGKTLMDEARYVNDAISYILTLYEKRANEEVHPSSVVIVAHSMGGIVARTLVTLDNYIADSVNTIITLSTPHAYPPITFDRDITQLYDLVGRWWRYKPDDVEIALVSLAGGHSDLLVLPDLTVTDSLGGISAFSYEIPGVELGIDHLAIVWCAELRQAVIDSINAITDFNLPSRTIPYQEKMDKLMRRLKRDFVSREDKPLLAGPSLFWGRPLIVDVKKRTDILLPARSSLISYKVTSNDNIIVSHQTEKEYRNYGEVNKTTLMWYSAGPYVPFANFTERLTVTVQPKTRINSSSDSVRVKVEIDWLATLANIVLHYRTLTACWPFSIVLITLMILISAQNVVSFGQALFSQVVGKWLFILAVLLSAMHCALVKPEVRALLRAVQFPSESENVTSLAYRGYDANDLLLGINDPELFWIPPLLLSIAACAVIAVFLVSSLLVNLNVKVIDWFARRKAENTEKKSPSPEPSMRSSPIKIAGIGAILVAALYVIPYQVSTVMLAIIQLLRIRDRRSISFGISQLLLWTSVVDAPIVAVWARNLTLEWLWAFASLRNIGSSLPIAIFVLFVTPMSTSLMIRQPLVRKLTLAVMAYIVAYALLYGGLHAFMLHHLTNYLAAWLIVANFGMN